MSKAVAPALMAIQPKPCTRLETAAVLLQPETNGFARVQQHTNCQTGIPWCRYCHKAAWCTFLAWVGGRQHSSHPLKHSVAQRRHMKEGCVRAHVLGCTTQPHA